MNYTEPRATGRETHEDLTTLLHAWSDGDRQALELLVPLVYDELKRLARAQLRRERTRDTLQTTALVHEAFLRLADHPSVRWQNRRHFYAAAARAMRRLLVDQARRRHAEKRARGRRPLSFEEVAEPAAAWDEDLVALDLALAKLYSLDRLKGWIVELRYYGGFSIDETAEIVGSSRATVIRQWRVARSLLYRWLCGDRPPGGRPAGDPSRADHRAT